MRNGKRLGSEKRRRQHAIESELNNLLVSTTVTESDTTRIRELKNMLNEIEKEKLKGAKIRSKTEWINERENCDRYFYEEERRRGNLKNMRSLKTQSGEIVTEKNEVCATAVKFYEKLFAAEDVDQNKMNRMVDRYVNTKLADEEKEKIEGAISKQEIAKAIKDMKNGKSPGLDGLTREFYVMFWTDLGDNLTDIMGNILLGEEMPKSWSEGLVTLIYKEKGDSNELKNWRPITLLNVDYKIMTKAIANRFRKVAGSVVNTDQSCGLPNRTIHDQLFFINDFIEYSNEKNRNGILLTIDQEKAFDRVHHDLIHAVLEKMNFGQTIKSLVKTIYKNMTNRIFLNGMITEPFNITRSVRQGDGLSMILFILVSELLATKIRQEMDITPIVLPNTKPKKLGMYADDISVMTENVRSLNCLDKLLKSYERASGAKVNAEKTELLLVGKWTKAQRKAIPEKFRGCIKDEVRVLGVFFGKNAANVNEEILMKKVTEVIDKWTGKNLSKQGKIEIINTLALSKIWHTAKVTGLRKKFIDKITSKLVQFFWFPKKYCPVSTRVLKNDKKTGGLDFPDIQLELEAYHLDQVAQALKDPSKPWAGMLKFRAGEAIAAATGAAPNRREIRAPPEGRNAKIATICKNLEKIQNEVNWYKVTLKQLKAAIRENVELPKSDFLMPETAWTNVINSSRYRKRVELNYLLAQNRMPLGPFLTKIGKTDTTNCKLCDRHPESQRHLFYECRQIQETLNKLKAYAKTHGVKLLTYEMVISHTPKLKKHLSEAISIYKESIWHTRCANSYDRAKDTQKQTRKMYDEKMRRE